MSSPIYPAPETPSSLWMTVDSTSAQYPSGGAGGSTATAASSDVIDATLCRITGFILETHNAGSNLVLMTHAGVTIETFSIPDATQVGVPQEFPEGLERPGPFAFKLSGGTAVYQVMYQVLKR